jgi:hypothetical protein
MYFPVTADATRYLFSQLSQGSGRRFKNILKVEGGDKFDLPHPLSLKGLGHQMKIVHQGLSNYISTFCTCTNDF